MVRLLQWSEANSFCAGEERAPLEHCGEVIILASHLYCSVKEAVKALNGGVVQCPEYCAVFSHTKSAYYVLWPWEKHLEVQDFLVRLQNSLVSHRWRVDGEGDGIGKKDRAPSISTTDTISGTPPMSSSIPVLTASMRDRSPRPQYPAVQSSPYSILTGSMRDRSPKLPYQNDHSILIRSLRDRSPTSPYKSDHLSLQATSSRPLQNQPESHGLAAASLQPPSPSLIRRAPNSNIDRMLSAPPSFRVDANTSGITTSTQSLENSRMDTSNELVTLTTPVSPIESTFEATKKTHVPVSSLAGDEHSMDRSLPPPSFTLATLEKTIDMLLTTCGPRQPELPSSLNLQHGPLEEFQAALHDYQSRNSSPPSSPQTGAERCTQDSIVDESPGSRRRTVKRVVKGATATTEEQTQVGVPTKVTDQSENEVFSSRTPQAPAWSQLTTKTFKSLIQDRLAAASPAVPVGELPKAEIPDRPSAASHHSPASLGRESPKKETRRAPAVPTTCPRMTCEEFAMQSDIFNPACPLLKARLLQNLGMSRSATIEPLEDNSGAFNDGIWTISNPDSAGLVLKLVPHLRVRASRKTDAEKYMAMQRRLPGLVAESSLSFPVKILLLRGPSGVSKDLVVMRRAPGFQITQHLYHKFTGGQSDTLLSIFKDFGAFLRRTHRAYIFDGRSMQHGDCQPSNVFYDESSGQFTMIDIADFGFGPYLAEGGENDVEHFIAGLLTLRRWYGDALLEACAREFRKGYSGK